MEQGSRNVVMATLHSCVRGWIRVYLNDARRGGCLNCHQQTIDQMRKKAGPWSAVSSTYLCATNGALMTIRTFTVLGNVSDSQPTSNTFTEQYPQQPFSPTPLDHFPYASFNKSYNVPASPRPPHPDKSHLGL